MTDDQMAIDVGCLDWRQSMRDKVRALETERDSLAELLDNSLGREMDMEAELQRATEVTLTLEAENRALRETVGELLEIGGFKKRGYTVTITTGSSFGDLK